MTAFVAGVRAACTVSGVTIIVSRIDVAEDGTRAGRRDRLGGRVERERRHDDIVAGPDAHRAQGDRQRVGAVGDADDVIDAEILGELALEGRDLRAEDEPALVDGVGRGADEPVAQARARGVDVEQGDWHGRERQASARREGPRPQLACRARWYFPANLERCAAR